MNKIDIIKAKLDVYKHHINLIKINENTTNEELKTAELNLKDLEIYATNLLNSMGYVTNELNLHEVIKIAYKKELYAKRFKCSFVNTECYIFSDLYNNQMLIKSHGFSTLHIVLDGINGHNVFILSECDHDF